MKKKPSALLGLFLGIVILPSIVAKSAEEIVGNANLELLKAEGSIHTNEFDPKEVNLKLIPETKLSAKIIEAWAEDENLPSLIGENLYLVSKQKISIEEASIILRSVSKMEGMEYYSNRAKKITTLYKNAYCIAGPNDKTQVPDNTEGNADGLVQFCLLNDNSLGEVSYKVSYCQTESEISMNLVNTTAVTYGPVKAVKPGNLSISLVMTICDDYVIVYMNLKAKFLSLGFLEKRIQRSLLSRLDAIFSWFSEEISSE